MNAGKRRLVIGILLVLAACAAGVVIWRVWFHPVRRFSVVAPGVLYRSAQPEGGQWAVLRDRYGLRSVIDLREDRPEADWQAEEQRFCRDNGIAYLKVPIGRERLTEEELAAIMEVLTDPARQPALVHCELGKVRTGVVVAAYRILADGWTVEKAVAESHKFKRPMKPAYEAYLKGLAGRRYHRGAATSQATSGPGGG